MEQQDQLQEDIFQVEAEVELNHQQVIHLLNPEEQVVVEMVLYGHLQQLLHLQSIVAVEEAEVYHLLLNLMEQEHQGL